MAERAKPTGPVRTVLSWSPELRAEVKRWRFEQMIESESEALRRLIVLGLEAAKSAKKKSPRD